MPPSVETLRCLNPVLEERFPVQKCGNCVEEAVVNEEEICLCPKEGETSGQVSRGGVRVRAKASTLGWWLSQCTLRRMAPVLVMALLLTTVWVSVKRTFPLPKTQPGVRYHAIPWHRHRPRARSSKTLPLMPPFTFDPAQLSLDAQTERIMDIYCRGPLLHAVQMANVFPDSKHFVDMPLKQNTSVFDVLVDFQRRQLALTDFQPDNELVPHVQRLHAFLDDHFDPPGADMEPITPFDYQEHVTPPLVAGIQNAELREWALALHRLWRHLGRMPKKHVTSSFLHAKPLKDVHLHRKQNVLIVPGGRFRESYYWDSYWIVHGLLVSNMKQTARGIVNNLLEYVAEFGFVPNGGRVYYLTRSQPPMLSDMVKLVARVDEQNAQRVTYDVSYLRSVVPILEQEYSFWMQRGPGGHAVELERPSRDDPEKKETHVLNRYISNANHPRPESYREDVDVAAEIYGDTVLSDHGNARETEANKVRYYNDVIAAAESGWDFSSRWLRNSYDMGSMETSCVVPVDLNAILYRMERNLMTFHAYLKNQKRAKIYEDAAKARQRAMDAVLWSDDAQTWKDYHLDNHTHSTIVSVSDYSPLWAKAFDPDDEERLERVIHSLKHSGLLQKGGIQTTTTFTGQQWDAPNAWPPEQDMVIEGLLAVNSASSHTLARTLSKTWIETSLAAWRMTGLMFEKYNATEIGGLGVGGEYFPQFGFGWTNGVVLKMLTIHQNLLLE
ncbi:hypothetical protein Poli38472_003669 [Pythium oligandrum]|uniref:Trehalase n=1 Tax=Pythium oligandrum TaxID=41045 RepID=A0A8K1CLV0_PYTOL|nr:hypothetical protein Poli38472_003669 [Pythium oligandrum]|eukprot:TMW65904.1 hypothetical protein Poli38472_003669 [Pythium oligandrum]